MKKPLYYTSNESELASPSSENLDFSSPAISAPAIELEEEVLGALLIDPGAMPLTASLPVNAFELESHRLIYKQMLYLQKNGKVPSINLLALRLSDRGLLSKIGGRRKLAQLADRVHSLYLDHHIRQLKEGYEKRVLNERLKFIATLSLDEAKEQVKKLQQEIYDQTIDAQTERLTLDLKALGQESNLVKRTLLRIEIALRYRLKRSDVDQALKYVMNPPQPAELRSLTDVLGTSKAEIDYLIPGMLPVGETVLLSSDPKVGKTLLAYDAAFAIATGREDFLGNKVKQGKVLIIQCDESMSTAAGRLIKRGFSHADNDWVQYVNSFSILEMPFLEQRLKEFRPSLVIIDSLRRINTGRTISENSAEFTDAIYQLKELLGRYSASGILIHHNNKNSDAVGVGRVRGSSAIVGAVWGVWQLDHILKPDPKNRKRLIVDPKERGRTLSVVARDVEGQRLCVELDTGTNHWLLNHGKKGVD